MPKGSPSIHQNASPVMTQTFEPTINIQPTITITGNREAPESTSLTSPASQSPVALRERAPQLRSEETREHRVKIDQDDMVSEQRGSGYYGHFAVFHNDPRGDSAADVEGVFARIKYYSRGTRVEHPEIVDYGCWLNEPTYRVDVSVGHTQEVCLAISDGLGSSHALANKRKVYEGSEFHVPTLAFTLDKRLYDVEVQLIYGDVDPHVDRFWFELSTWVNPHLKRLAEPSWDTAARHH